MRLVGWLVDALPCAKRRASFIQARTDQLILTLGLWTGAREVQLGGEVRIEAGDGNVRTGVSVHLSDHYFNSYLNT